MRAVSVLLLSAALLLCTACSAQMLRPAWSTTPVTCNVRDVTIDVARPSAHPSPASPDAVKRKVQRATFADPRSTTVSCIDARDSMQVFGTPGGEASEFVTALAVFREFGGAVTTQQHVDELFRRWMANADPSRPFYLHTDRRSMTNVATQLGISAEQFATLPANQRAQALQLMLDPANMGCGHVRLMFSNPDRYQVPQDISRFFITSFLEYMWSVDGGAAAELRYTALPELPGSLDGRAIVIVNTDTSALPQDDHCRYLQPQVAPNDNIGSAFIVTPAAVDTLRRRLVGFFSRQSPFPSADSMLVRFNALAANHTGNSVAALAPTVPIYTATVHLAPSSSVAQTTPAGDSSSSASDSNLRETNLVLAIVTAALVIASLAMGFFLLTRVTAVNHSAAAPKSEAESASSASAAAAVGSDSSVEQAGIEMTVSSSSSAAEPQA